MNKTGSYNNRCTWLQRSTSTSSIGQQEETFSSNGYLWCAIDNVSGRKQTDYGAQRTGNYSTIRIRNYPAITAVDRLQDNLDNIWVIESITKGDNETICDCYKFDEAI